ncbi:MAG: hypothetical protein HFI34_11130 [Lachnospiraceae bacterium]|nr:hypothetical protein [Lachnospiraceae bacterium]
MSLKSVTGNIEKAVIEFEIDGTKQSVSVQYNPASVSFSTYAKETQLDNRESNENSSESTHQNTNTASTSMSIDLIFDDVNNFDAFMNEKMILSAGTAVAAVSKIKGGRSEISNIFAFINLLNCSNNRQVTFYWSEFSFQGELISANTEFTMFNIMGNPIRGKVSLSIQQDYSDEGISKNENDRAFDKLFGGDMFTSSETGAGSIKDKAGNLLNLNLL